MATNTCNIVQAINSGNQRILDYMQNEKIESLRAENVALKGRISNNEQSAYIINKLSPCPVPAYLTCNPNTGLTFPQGYPTNGCGCSSIQ